MPDDDVIIIDDERLMMMKRKEVGLVGYLSSIPDSGVLVARSPQLFQPQYVNIWTSAAAIREY